ncbi:MAG: hypothetical protein ACJAVK_003523 [Akkermansiaceae bacterium]|jgi:hypothetical protein
MDFTSNLMTSPNSSIGLKSSANASLKKLMKIKSIQMVLAIAATVLALSSRGGAQDAPGVQIPIGTFEITFMNGVFETCEFAEDATVKVTQENRASVGRAEVKDGKIVVRYEDDRIEEWSLIDGAYFVNHWHPISSWPDQGSVMGFAEKHLEGALEVHEWGTFTILQGSNGKTIRWYQAPKKLVDLPPFVQQHSSAFSKARSANLLAGLDSLRMETPVLYFYPERAMDIRVAASFPNGRITEVFPPSSYRFNHAEDALWRGTLLPPDAPEKSRVPAATGTKGRHYAAARAVPDAWLFSQLVPESTVAVAPPPLAKPIADPIDHFIFYRGAGNAETFPIRAVEQESPGTYQLTNFYRETIPKLFALRVVNGKSSWTTIAQLAQLTVDKENKVWNRQTITFPETTGAVKEVAAELRDAMVTSLHAEGLTLAEAKAMVATWDDLWFTDPGTRILAVLPQSFADEMVPLKISPKPTKLERVFVARLELINKAQEQVLTTVLDTSIGMAQEVASEKLAALQLGRYSAGGMARAKTLINAQIEKRFAKLEQIRKEQETLRTASAQMAE